MKKAMILPALVLALAMTGCGNVSKESGGVHSVPTVFNETVISDEPAASGEQEVEELHSIEAQVQVIASNIDLWAGPEDYADVYFYAVTDLDGNGRLEIIASNMGGTGVYTYSSFYEVNEDFNGLTTWEYMTQEGDSQADIAADFADGFYDSQKRVMYYIFEDFSKSGAAEYYENKRALYVEDGQVKEIILAYRTTIYTDPETEPEITCTDKDGNEISEEEYEAIADKVFAGLDKKKVYFGWCEFFEPDELTNMSDEERVGILAESYEKFKVK